VSKLTDMLRAQFECNHENPDCPKTVEVDCDQLGEAIVALCELFDGAERARDKAFETIGAFQEASGLCVPAEENGGDPGGVQPRHVGNHIDKLTKQADALAKRVEELESMLVDAYERPDDSGLVNWLMAEAVAIATRRAGRAS